MAVSSAGSTLLTGRPRSLRTRNGAEPLSVRPFRERRPLGRIGRGGELCLLPLASSAPVVTAQVGRSAQCDISLLVMLSVSARRGARTGSPQAHGGLGRADPTSLPTAHPPRRRRSRPWGWTASAARADGGLKVPSRVSFSCLFVLTFPICELQVCSRPTVPWRSNPLQAPESAPPARTVSGGLSPATEPAPGSPR